LSPQVRPHNPRVRFSLTFTLPDLFLCRVRFSMDEDLLLCIARQAVRSRADLKVVVCCTGVDAGPYVRHFGLAGGPLALASPLFPVALRNDPVPAGSTLGSPASYARNHVVPAVLRALQDQTEGHALVFLPSHGEVTATMEELLLAESLPLNVLPMAVYASMGPGHQVRSRASPCASLAGGAMVDPPRSPPPSHTYFRL
jgi:HrpA-like RNA helicase